jgi:hypothetical protein
MKIYSKYRVVSGYTASHMISVSGLYVLQHDWIRNITLMSSLQVGN